MATNRETATLVAAILGIGIAVWAVLDQRANTDKLAQELQSTNTALQEAIAEKDALANMSLPGFLDKFNAHAATLKSTADAYEEAKAVKGADIPDFDAGRALTHAANELYKATDSFTDFIGRWRSAAQLLNKMLDGNATQLENSRRENDADGVHEAALRIVNSAPDLAAPLRMALDRLKVAPSSH